MLTQNDVPNYEFMEQHSELIRSKAINGAVIMESMISEILTNFFGTNDTREIISKNLFSDVLTFDQKINLFNSLNKNNLFEPTAGSKTLNSDLVYVKMFRNYMAHSILFNDANEVRRNDKKELFYIAFTQREKNKKIQVNLYSKDYNLEKNIFSYNFLVEIVNRSTKELLDILEWLKTKKQ